MTDKLTHAEKMEFPAEFPSDIPPAVTWADLLLGTFGKIYCPNCNFPPPLEWHCAGLGECGCACHKNSPNLDNSNFPNTHD